MADLAFSPDADLALERLEQGSPAERDLALLLLDRLDALAADPADHHRRRYSNGLWRVDVRDTFNDWMILWWENGEEVVVEYIGPIPGAS